MKYESEIELIEYKIENDLDVDEFIVVLNNSTLGERRPVNDRPRIAMMLKNANMIITAREEGKLVGIARSLTDFCYCTYLSDLAVDEAYQKRGIGRELIRRTKIAGGNAKIILLAAPAAADYYPKIGMVKHNHCFLLSEIQELN
jgi:predicted N-acetyltransferase YhbS